MTVISVILTQGRQCVRHIPVIPTRGRQRPEDPRQSSRTGELQAQWETLFQINRMEINWWQTSTSASGLLTYARTHMHIYRTHACKPAREQSALQKRWLVQKLHTHLWGHPILAVCGDSALIRLVYQSFWGRRNWSCALAWAWVPGSSGNWPSVRMAKDVLCRQSGNLGSMWLLDSGHLH